MEHNKFDYVNDIMRPLKYFLRINNIIKTFKKTPLTDYQLNLLRQDGYCDKNDICFFQHLGFVSKNRYYNNHNKDFNPPDLNPNSKVARNQKLDKDSRDSKETKI